MAAPPAFLVLRRVTPTARAEAAWPEGLLEADRKPQGSRRKTPHLRRAHSRRHLDGEPASLYPKQTRQPPPSPAVHHGHLLYRRHAFRGRAADADRAPSLSERRGDGPRPRRALERGGRRGGRGLAP